MRRTIICITILAAMAATGVALDMHTQRVTEDISARVAALGSITGHDERVREAVSISRDWEDFCAKNIFLTNNEGAFEVSKALAHIVSEITTEDESAGDDSAGDDSAGDESAHDETVEECIEAEMLIDMYVKSRAFSIENIF